MCGRCVLAAIPFDESAVNPFVFDSGAALAPFAPPFVRVDVGDFFGDGLRCIEVRAWVPLGMVAIGVGSMTSMHDGVVDSIAAIDVHDDR